jgi:hypothetical protein
MTAASSSIHAFKFLAKEVGGYTNGRFNYLKTTQDITMSICEVRY